jgi:hypothetical protein
VMPHSIALAKVHESVAIVVGVFLVALYLFNHNERFCYKNYKPKYL